MATVLIVEDYDNLRELYRGAFEEAGYTTVVAATGTEALKEIQTRRFDAIVLDLLMLGLSGMDVLRRHDFRKHNPDTRIVVVSNLDSPNLVEQAEMLGAAQYLVKSHTTPKQIVETVNALLAQSPSAKAA